MEATCTSLFLPFSQSRRRQHLQDYAPERRPTGFLCGFCVYCLVDSHGVLAHEHQTWQLRFGEKQLRSAGIDLDEVTRFHLTGTDQVS